MCLWRNVIKTSWTRYDNRVNQNTHWCNEPYFMDHIWLQLLINRFHSFELERPKYIRWWRKLNTLQLKHKETTSKLMRHPNVTKHMEQTQHKVDTQQSSTDLSAESKASGYYLTQGIAGWRNVNICCHLRYFYPAHTFTFDIFTVQVTKSSAVDY